MNNYVPSPTLEKVSGFGSHQTRELLKPIFPSFRYPDPEWKSSSNLPNQSADPGPIPARSVFDPMKAVILFLFALSFVLPTAMAQTTVFQETFPNSTVEWISNPNGSNGIWHLEGISGTGSPLAFGSTIAGDGTIGDSAYYAYYKNQFSLVSNRTYRISVKCSLAANAGTKEVVLGLGPDLAHARRSTAKVVLQTGAISTNGWSTFTATFNTTGDLSSWTEAVPVLWANVLGTPRTAMVYADDIKIELLSNLPPESVSIETPGSWALVNSPAGIKVTAADPDNNIQRVKFYSGTTYLGEDLSAPYLFSTTLPPGTHSVKAVAFDQYGLSKESANRTFVINSAPTALSTSPTNGTVYSTGPVDLVASAADEDFNLVQVEFYVNGQKVGQTNTAPYSFRYYNTAGGQFTWYARAVDQLDLWGVSADRTFTIGALPTTSIISPQNHGTIGSCNVYIQAETTYGPGGIRTMNFFRNDSLIGTDSISPYEYKGSGWEPREYSIEARGVDMQGDEIEGAHIGITVESADLIPDISEASKGCNYYIYGTLAPYQTLTLPALSNATDQDGHPFTGLEIVTGKEATEWRQFLNFTDLSPVELPYTLTNPYGCELQGTFTLHPESSTPPDIERELVLVSGLKLDPNTGEYYYCEPDAANLVIQPVVTNTTGTVWYQALNPSDLSQVYQTFTNGTVQITSPMLEEQQLILNAITPLGCTGGHPLTINFSGRQAPVVTVAPVISHGGLPVIAKANVTEIEPPFQFSWFGIDTCFGQNCDSARISNFTTSPKVKLLGGPNNCASDLTQVKIIPNFEKRKDGWLSYIGNSKEYSIICLDSIIVDTLRTDAKISAGNSIGIILSTNETQISSYQQATNPINGIQNIVNVLKNSELNVLNEFPKLLGPGFYHYDGDLVLSDSLIFTGDSFNLTYINIHGNLELDENFILIANNSRFINTIWHIEGSIIINKLTTNRPGILFSTENIFIGPNYIHASYLYSLKNVKVNINNGFSHISTLAYDGDEYDQILGIDTDDCLPLNPKSNNMLCNPGFQYIKNDVLGGSEIFNSDVMRWTSEETPDIFNSKIVCQSNETCFSVPLSFHNPGNIGVGCTSQGAGVTVLNIPDQFVEDCIYAGICTRGGGNGVGARESMRQRLRGNLSIRSDERYYIGFYAASCLGAEFYPSSLAIEFGSTSFSPRFRINLNSNGLVNAGRWVKVAQVLDIRSGPLRTHNIFSLGKFGPYAQEFLAQSPQDATNQVTGRVANPAYNGVAYTFIDNVFVLPFPKLKQGPILAACFQEVDPFFGGYEAAKIFGNVSNAIFTWIGPNNFESHTLGRIKPTSGGDYSLTISIDGTSYSIGTINVQYQSGPYSIDVTTNPQTICTGDNVSLSPFITLPPGASVSWTGPNLFSSNLLYPSIPISSVDQSGDYTISVTGTCLGSPFSWTGSKSVTVNERHPITDILPVSVSCSNFPYSFSAVSPVAGLYRWSVNDNLVSSSSTSNVLTYSFPSVGTYNVRAIQTESNGCVSSRNKEINISDLDFTLSISQSSGTPVVGGFTQFTLETSLVTPPSIKWLVGGVQNQVFEN